MTEIAERAVLRDTATAVVHESYAFACMRCGHGWEQSYEIEHHNDAEGRDFVMYVVDGHVVPSPLSRPTCQNCDGHVVRIMRAGQVSSVRDAERRHHVSKPRPVEAVAPDAAEPKGHHHHWHLSDLLHPFHRKAS
ncbi:hypothetical protein Sipo8835_21495 [Streptomyces ipomoeae]|jgi:hypothetical protein|uniref:C2H2-type domain-containing protein n=2 Tax=Streptomyces ipomoeae TaxID=103232 RepID=L1L3L4_9ACTN|nr:hypothetical protein [Streptomyces ipomoeae]EKX67275.1 hypothetical protein STRIP9103_03843 [Streptomyces ipomoeae 91-03]MDX2699021.1 hypothetical protein [Streptomyces ipomoeae]MDX2827820.1 hypothetical protein [Streptomyces ipomoeae]MDX2843647.1 hypothetical protein [Streptomyces ipomoeae]MDX2880395.1 hypothetical protein [Streptomyces ipomoeae]